MTRAFTNFLPAILLAGSLGLVSCNETQIAEPDYAKLTNAKSRTIPEEEKQDYIVSLNKELAGPGAVGKIHSMIARHKLGNNNHKLINGKAFNGFVISLTPDQVQKLKSDKDLAFIELDRALEIPDESTENEIEIPNYVITPDSNQNISWGAVKIGVGDGTLSGRTAWILDSGIQLDHPDLNVDAVRSRSFISTSTSPADEFGHGTRVAGIVGAKNNGYGVVGIAAGAPLVSLRIAGADGNALTSSMIYALNHAAEHAQPGDVVNISYGGIYTSTALEDAVKAVADLGIYVTLAAGNNNMDVAYFSPAKINYNNVFTVSGMRPDGTFMGVSNWGAGVDFCAPGTALTSTKPNSEYATSIGGTSYSTPHITGLLLIRGGNNIPIQGYVSGDPDGNPDPIPHL